jgi:hypothetical protein
MPIRTSKLVAAAQKLIQLIKEQAPDIAGAIGVNITDVKTANIRLGKVVSSGTGVNIERTKATGDIVINEVQAGMTGAPPKTGPSS